MSIELAPKAREGHPLFVLIFLLLLQLTLLSLQIEDPGGTLLIRRWVLTAEAPFLNASSFLSSGARRIWSNYFWLRGAREENRQLQESLRQLAAQANQLEELKRENIRLRGLVNLNEGVPFETIGGRVVSRTPNYLSNVLYINRGTADGIAPNAPVLAAGGVIGRTVLVARYTAEVQLITNADASTGVMIDSTRSPGVLKGSGAPTLDLNYISNSDRVEVGDAVVTSGLDSLYPKGLLIGKVVESRKGNSVFRVIKVAPSADLFHFEEVSILLGRQKHE